MPDAVVIGSGPNGLVAANTLVDAGWDVVVCEAQPTPGGAVRSAELIEPGYTNDCFSAFYPLGAASPAVAALHLEDHGLRWLRAPLVLAHPAIDGTCPIISTDLGETAASLDGLHAGDGDAWRALYDQWQRLGDGLLQSFLQPFPPVRAAGRLVGALRPSEVLRFVRFVLLPVRALGEESFGGEAARRLLAGNALHTDLFPESTLSGVFGWLLAMLGQQLGWPVPEGGAGRLSGAMISRLESLGGTIRCGAAVERIIVRKGRAVAVRLSDGTEVDAGRAVLADVAAPPLYLDLVGAQHLPGRLVDDLRRFSWDSSTIKVDWNLDAPIPWSAEQARRAGTVHVAEDVDQLTHVSAQLATGLVPARPFLLVGQQSMTDPTRMPAGKETAWGYTHLPRKVKGDAGDDGLTGRWDDARELELFVARMEAQIEALAPGFTALIRGRHVLTPGNLQAHDANLVLGAINGGTTQIHQQLIFRPTPGLARPETPIDGLYLASSSAHPGGGVHGACGANAAKAALGPQRRLRR